MTYNIMSSEQIYMEYGPYYMAFYSHPVVIYLSYLTLACPMTFSAGGRARSSEVWSRAQSSGVGDTVISSGGGDRRTSCRGSSRSCGSCGSCSSYCSFDTAAITAISSARAGSSGVRSTVTIVPSVGDQPIK